MNPKIFKRLAACMLGASVLGACAGEERNLGPETGRVAAGWGCPLFTNFSDLETATKAKDVQRVAYMTGITGAAPTCHFIKGLRYTVDRKLTNYAKVVVEFPDGTTRPLWVRLGQLGG